MTGDDGGAGAGGGGACDYGGGSGAGNGGGGGAGGWLALTVVAVMPAVAVAMVEALAVVTSMKTGFSSKSPPQLPGAKHSALNLTKMLTLPTQARTWLPSMRYVVVAWQLRSLPHLVPVLGRCPFALLWWRWWLR